jgi:hypothetical protein
MAHRNQIGSLLSGHYPCKPRNFQRVALRIVRKSLEDGGLEYNESTGLGFAFGGKLGGNIHHLGTARAIVMGKLLRHCEVLYYRQEGGQVSKLKFQVVGFKVSKIKGLEDSRRLGGFTIRKALKSLHF